MAARLKMPVEQLASTILSWTSEERFAGLKRFYLSVYPKSSEFYEHFNKFKRKNVQEEVSKLIRDFIKNNFITIFFLLLIKKKTGQLKKIKTNEDEELLSKNFLDYYENINTFENVLGLIEDEVVCSSSEHKCADTVSNKAECSKSEVTSKEEIDSLYHRFMENLSEIDETNKFQNKIPENQHIDFENVKISSKSSEKNRQDQDKYDMLLKELFD